VRAPLYVAWKLAAYLRIARGYDVRRWERSDRAGEVIGRTRTEIAGVPIDAVDLPAALGRIAGAFGRGRVFQVSTVNLDFLVRAQRDPRVRAIFGRSDLNVADGAPVVWLSRLLGAPVPGRVAGADLVPALLQEAARLGTRVFLLGGEGGVAAAAAERAREMYPDLVIAGSCEPPRAAADAMDNDEILARVAEARTDILLVAFGHPKQERWIDLNRDELPVSVAIGVGCLFDLLAGRRKRAPAWMQAVGLEWAFRLAQEPGRLVGRYLTDAAWLIPIAARVVRSRVVLAASEAA
jgi:N-acetylglucosaminyldiphosphoundecaprenol N-acetyl-beta-D-mannosaminyltransferase